jgi:hypothetical protein
MDVAKTILQQMGGVGRLSAMIGAKYFTASGNGVSFKIGGGAKKGINGIRVNLNSMDTYDVSFIKMRKYEQKVVAEVNGVYCDQLKSVVENNIGMYLSL